MYVDSQAQLWASATALTTTAVSTNCYDQQNGSTTGNVATGVLSANNIVPDLSRGEPLAIVITITTAGTHAGTETYEFQAITATANDLTTNQAIVNTTGTIPTASVATYLALGQRIVLVLSPGYAAMAQRYVGAKYVSANSASVSVEGHIAPFTMIQREAYYPTAIVIK